MLAVGPGAVLALRAAEPLKQPGSSSFKSRSPSFSHRLVPWATLPQRLAADSPSAILCRCCLQTMNPGMSTTIQERFGFWGEASLHLSDLGLAYSLLSFLEKTDYVRVSVGPTEACQKL